MQKIKKLIEKLNTNDLSKMEEPMNTLAEMQDEVRAYLMNHLRYEDRESVIAGLLVVIGRIDGEKSISTMLNYYNNSEYTLVRKYSVRALAEIGDYSVILKMLNALENENESSVQEEIISLIAKLTVKHPLEVLIKSLYAEDSFVQEAAGGAIYYIHKQITDTLLDKLENATTVIEKVELIEVLRMIESKRAIPLLESLVKSDEKIVRAVAKSAIDRIQNPSVSK